MILSVHGGGSARGGQPGGGQPGGVSQGGSARGGQPGEGSAGGGSARGGVSQDMTTAGVIAMRQAVCLLRSRRRTFLFLKY